MNSLNLGLTPPNIYKSLIGNNVVNPYTLKPYSVKTIRRLINVVTNGTVWDYVNRSVNVK